MNMQNVKAKVRAERCGFTIAEMLMVVIVIALIASVSGGLYVGTYKRMLVEKAARHFVLTAKYARIMAIEKQRQYKIQLDVANNGFYLVTTQWDEEAEQTEQIVVKNPYCKPVEFEGDVNFEDVQITPTGLETASEDDEQQAIVFSPNGTAQTAVIQIGDGKTHYTICISTATGRAKMYFGEVEDLKTDTDVRIGTIDLDAE